MVQKLVEDRLFSFTKRRYSTKLRKSARVFRVCVVEASGCLGRGGHYNADVAPWMALQVGRLLAQVLDTVPLEFWLQLERAVNEIVRDRAFCVEMLAHYCLGTRGLFLGAARSETCVIVRTDFR